MHRRVATYHAARAHGRQAVAVRAIMQGALTQVSVRAAREQAGLWPASGVMAEAGAMVPTSDSDLTDWSKVSVLQLLRMSLHERLCTATLLQHSQARARDACLKRSIVALCGVAWVQQSPCGIAAVPRGGRRALTSVEKVGFNVLWSFLLRLILSLI